MAKQMMGPSTVTKMKQLSPGHKMTVSSGHKMTMVNSKGRSTTQTAATGASNKGVTKQGTTPNGGNSAAMGKSRSA